MEKSKLGTPIHMAPEVCEGKPYRLSPDWWGVGILIYQLMNKKVPYESEKI